MLDLTHLLLHSEATPSAAREALERASFGPKETRDAALETAAEVLEREADLHCADARELVGLDPADCSCA